MTASPMLAQERLCGVPWRALEGLADALEPALCEVLGGHPAERVVDRFLRRHRDLDGAGRAAAKEAVYGVALWRLRLAWHAGTAAPRHLLAALLRDLAGVDGATAERVARLPPGALAAPRPPPDDLHLRASMPPWLVDVLRAEAGAGAEALADALNLPGPICFRPNLLRTTPAALAGRLAAEGVATRPGALVASALVVRSERPNVYGLASYREGLFEVQDEGSQLLGALVDARPRDAVLDLCAGAGGKTLQLAAAVAPGGVVHASDVDGARLERLRRRAEAAGAAGLVRVHPDPDPGPATFDRVLVDAPCSELGALRRGPDQRFRMDPAAFEALPTLQLALLARGAAAVRPGGRLVYATCTLRRQENEAVAEAFERAHPGFLRLRPDLPGGVAAPGGFVRTWPHRQGCDGFFAALWTRPLVAHDSGPER